MTYAWNAEDYAQSSSAQQQWALELITRLRLAGQESILDIGCGDGRNTAELARQVPAGSVLGMDASAEMIRIAQTHYPNHQHPNLRFVVQDVQSLAEQERFDVVFSNAALHWVLDHPPLLQRIAAALKPGGRVLVQMGGKGNAADLLAVAEPLLQAPTWQPYFREFTFPWGFYDAETYSTWACAAGLKPQRVELIRKDMVQENEAAFQAWIRTTWLPYTHRLPPNRHEEFIAELARNYGRQYPPDAQGRWHLAMVRLEVELIKPPV